MSVKKMILVPESEFLEKQIKETSIEIDCKKENNKRSNKSSCQKIKSNKIKETNNKRHENKNEKPTQTISAESRINVQIDSFNILVESKHQTSGGPPKSRRFIPAWQGKQWKTSNF